jgi:3-hydroxyisobutyrate dehydrogenase-like beta-hydroxyacid dehydrogenase
MAGEVLGFIGLGRMGGPMSGRLLDAGYGLSVFDTNADAMKPLVARGAKPATSPADVASAAKTVLVSLPTPDVVQSVALDFAIGGGRGKAQLAGKCRGCLAHLERLVLKRLDREAPDRA